MKGRRSILPSEEAVKKRDWLTSILFVTLCVLSAAAFTPQPESSSESSCSAISGELGCCVCERKDNSCEKKLEDGIISCTFQWCDAEASGPCTIIGE
jgi:hypothetical protein